MIDILKVLLLEMYLNNEKNDDVYKIYLDHLMKYALIGEKVEKLLKLHHETHSIGEINKLIEEFYKWRQENKMENEAILKLKKYLTEGFPKDDFIDYCLQETDLYGHAVDEITLETELEVLAPLPDLIDNYTDQVLLVVERIVDSFIVEDLNLDLKENLCDSCIQNYPSCNAEQEDIYFGNGIGNDNIFFCKKYAKK